MRNRVLLVLVITILAVFLASCSPKEQGRWNGGTDIKIGELPSDICIRNGVPQVISATSESDGGFSLIYIRNNGDVVVRAWLTDPVLHVALKPAGQFYWTGGSCPSQ